MPPSGKSHGSTSRKPRGSKHSSRHTSSQHSSSFTSTHPSSSSSYQSSHSFSSDWPTDDFKFNDHGGLSHYKDTPVVSTHKSNDSALHYASQQDRKAREDSKKKSRARPRAGPSSFTLDREERRKQQNRDSSRAADAGKRAKMAATKEIYVTESVNEASQEAQLRYYQDRNRDNSDYVNKLKSRKHK